MAYSTEIGAELSADHRLIELLCRQLDLESDPTRRRAMTDQITRIIDWHEMFDRRYLGASGHVDVPDQADANTDANAGNADQGGETADAPGLAPADLGGSRHESSHPDGPADDATATVPSQPLQSLFARAQRHIREEEDHTLPAFESQAHWMVLEDLGERAREIRLARAAR